MECKKPRGEREVLSVSHNVINPADLPDTATGFGVAGGVVAGNILFISGQAPVDRELRIVGETLEEQTRVVFDAFTTVLDDAGFMWDDVAKINAFVSTETPDAVVEYCRLLKEYLGRYSSRDSVAHTYVVVQALALPGVLIEVEGVAVKSTSTA